MSVTRHTKLKNSHHFKRLVPDREVPDKDKEKDELRTGKLFTSHQRCCFCQDGECPELGLFYRHQEADIATHQYCMLFSSGLPQHGDDHEGFAGFLLNDLRKEANRAYKQVCKVCSNPGASAGCAVKSCRSTFHFKCGFEDGAQFIFSGSFPMRCFAHREFQDFSALELGVTRCPVCQEEIYQACFKQIVKTPCCKNVFAHKSCIQRQADVSGYFFRCPTCNNSKDFRQEMCRHGVFVPDRDAGWEDGNAFAELLNSYSKCDWPLCLCPEGVTYHSLTGPWKMLRCGHCGQSAVHRRCIGSFFSRKHGYVCSDCDDVVHVSKLKIKVQPSDAQERARIQKDLLDALIDKNDSILSQSLELSSRSLERFRESGKLPEALVRKYNLKEVFVVVTPLTESEITASTRSLKEIGEVQVSCLKESEPCADHFLAVESMDVSVGASPCSLASEHIPDRNGMVIADSDEGKLEARVDIREASKGIPRKLPGVSLVPGMLFRRYDNAVLLSEYLSPIKSCSLPRHQRHGLAVDSKFQSKNLASFFENCTLRVGSEDRGTRRSRLRCAKRKTIRMASRVPPNGTRASGLSQRTLTDYVFGRVLTKKKVEDETSVGLSKDLLNIASMPKASDGLLDTAFHLEDTENIDPDEMPLPSLRELLMPRSSLNRQLCGTNYVMDTGESSCEVPAISLRESNLSGRVASTRNIEDEISCGLGKRRVDISLPKTAVDNSLVSSDLQASLNMDDMPLSCLAMPRAFSATNLSPASCIESTNIVDLPDAYDSDTPNSKCRKRDGGEDPSLVTKNRRKVICTPSKVPSYYRSMLAGR